MDTNKSSRRQHCRGREHADRDPAFRFGHGHRKSHRHQDKSIAGLNLGNSSRVSGQRAGHDMVQNWLAQSTIANQNYPTASEDHAGPTNTHQYYDLHEQRQVRSPPLDTRRSALPHQPEPPFDVHVGTRLRSPPQGFEHSPKSRKRPLSDSSILSVCKNQRLSPKDRYSAFHQARALHGPAPAELSRRLKAISQGADSDEPSSPIPAYRSKKPRNKTREDKYEHKKDKHRARKSTEDQPPPKPSKRKKEDKKRAMTSSKNVMSNWASKAVLNDRITQPIKPGIFQNGREANKKPVYDLVFSGMHFLQERTGNAGPKPLSERRLRELEKQQKEMKEVSSFFLPAEAPHETLKTNVGDQRGHNQKILRKRQERSESASRQYSTSKSSQSELTASRDYLLSEQVLQRYRDPGSSGQNIKEDRRHQGDCNQPVSSRDSRPTTYFSWSTSPSRSPIRKNGPASQTSSGFHDDRTTTPETVRRALVDSGIYRGTGIAPYDPKKSTTDEEQGGAESSTNGHAASEDDMGRHDLQRRLEALLPPSWRVHRSQTKAKPSSKPRSSAEDVTRSARDSTQKQQHLHSTVGNARKDAAESAKITRHNEHITQERPDKGGNPQDRVGLDEDTHHDVACLVSPDNDDHISITSRDLMPPPPLPDHISQPHLGGAVQKPSATRPDTRYLPTNKELYAAAQVMARHAVVHKNAYSRTPDETSHDMSTRVSSEYGLIAPLQSASWVTPWPKPPIPSLTTDTKTSRLSPISLYDVDRPAGKGSLPTMTQDKAGQHQESMAEFIARIEREADGLPPTSMNEHHKARESISPIPDTELMGWEDVDIETTDFGNVYDCEMGSMSGGLHENQPLHVPYNKSSGWVYGGQFTNGELEKVVHLAGYECPPGEFNYYGSTEDRLKLPEPLSQRGLCGDHDGDMSSFWGPNNFL